MNTEVFYKHENTSKVSGPECAHAGNFQGRSPENSSSWGILQWYQGLQIKCYVSPNVHEFCKFCGYDGG